MDRVVMAKVNGREVTLNYSVEVMFGMTEKFGTLQAALDIISKDDREGFEALRWFFITMANDGELMRRYEGHDSQPMIEEKDITPRMKPIDFQIMKQAVSDAISAGYICETQQKSSEVDEGLQELEQKKTDIAPIAPASTI
ncbi:MAG: hypothetical protein RSG53_08875 [Oscillospiraceae bacterium]